MILPVGSKNKPKAELLSGKRAKIAAMRTRAVEPIRTRGRPYGSKNKPKDLDQKKMLIAAKVDRFGKSLQAVLDEMFRP
jgi:hypothetical protein